MGILKYAAMTDPGQIRTINQDAIFTFLATGRSVEPRPDLGIFIVADGMGGQRDGERAAAITIRIMAEMLTEAIFRPMFRDDLERVPVSEALENAALEANNKIMSEVAGSGSTFVAAVILGDLAYIAHAGDSRAYMITAEGIEQLTSDHSLVQRLVDLGHITETEAKLHPNTSVLYRGLGQAEGLEIDTIKRRLLPGTTLVLCCDGLWRFVSRDELREIITTAHDLEAACASLIALTNSRGGDDNISVIIVQMPEE